MTFENQNIKLRKLTLVKSNLAVKLRQIWDKFWNTCFVLEINHLISCHDFKVSVNQHLNWRKAGNYTKHLIPIEIRG